MKRVLVGLLFCMVTTVQAQTVNTVNIVPLDFRDPQGKEFGYDDYFLVLVNNDIPHAKGLRARLFGGTAQQVRRGALRITSDGCRIYDTNVYPIYDIRGRINLGSIFDETFLAYNNGTIGPRTYTIVVEQGDESTSLIKIPTGDGLDMYLRYAYTFVVKPTRTSGESAQASITATPQIVARVANADTRANSASLKSNKSRRTNSTGTAPCCASLGKCKSRNDHSCAGGTSA